MATIDDIDLTDLDVFVERMPHDWFDLLRREAPVWRHPATDEHAVGNQRDNRSRRQRRQN